MFFHGAGDRLHRLESRALSPADPLVEEYLGPFPRWLRIDLLEGKPHAPRACRFEVGRAQRIEHSALPGGQIDCVLGPDISCAAQLWSRLHFVTAHVVDGITNEFHDVETVEGDLSLCQVFSDAFDEGRTHIGRGMLDAAGITTVVFEVIGELTHGIGTTPVGNEDNAPSIDVDHQGNVVVAALCSRLVDADTVDIRQIHARDRRLNIVEDDAPQTLVRDLEKAFGCNRDWQVHGERHGEAFEQQCEARARPRPRHGDEAHATLGTVDARRACGQERLMLEEIEMPPGLCDRVMHPGLFNANYMKR